MSDLYISGALPFSEQIAAGFYGIKGWKKEPVTSKLDITIAMVGKIFPQPNDKFSITGNFNGVPIGQCNAIEWKSFLDQMPLNLYSLKDSEHDGVQTFCKLMREVLSYEMIELKTHFFLIGLTMNDIAHRSGLMTMISGKGFATQLVIESDKLLKNSGFKAAVVKTSHNGSRKIYEKEGYVVFKEFDLKKFDIEIDDKYTILYKIF